MFMGALWEPRAEEITVGVSWDHSGQQMLGRATSLGSQKPMGPLVFQVPPGDHWRRQALE